MNYLERKAIDGILEKCRVTMEGLVQTIVLSKGKSTEDYLLFYFDKPEVHGLMEEALKGGEERARAELYRELWKAYEGLRERAMVRDVQFLLPDGTVLLRLRTPHLYGDKPSQVNPVVKRALETSLPQKGFGTDGVLSGYVYAYPLKDGKGKKLGLVVFYVSLEVLRSFLKEVNPGVSYAILLKEDILQRVFTEYRHYYEEVKGLKGWVIEDPYRKLKDSAGSLSQKEEELLRALVLESSFRRALSMPGNHALVFRSQGAYYKAIVVKIGEGDKESAVLVGMPSGADIQSISRSYTTYEVVFSLLALALSLYTYFYLRGLYSLRLSHKSLEMVLSLANAGVVVLDKGGRARFLNDTALELLGYKKEELLNKVFHDLVHYHTGPLEGCPIYRSAVKGMSYKGEDSFLKRDGNPIEVEVDVKPIRIDAFLEGVILSFYDITTRKEKEKRVYDMATHDQLTKLHNRWYAEEFFASELARAKRQGLPLSILMIDVDNFKNINDTYGHNVGDMVLKSLAQILKSSVRSYDLVARWGGEEFLILLLGDGQEEAVSIGERIRRSVESLSKEGIPKFTVSVGVASYREGDDINSLIERADKALYKAKSQGKNRVVAGE
ncbi:MAG: GGDEF domain-containing protein [Aquificaceae bacterium]|nr:GGDEF domain-containing protein [Aquificaceae bacterium]